MAVAVNVRGVYLKKKGTKPNNAGYAENVRRILQVVSLTSVSF